MHLSGNSGNEREDKFRGIGGERGGKKDEATEWCYSQLIGNIPRSYT